ncbi:MAG: acylphosphatase [Chloroflexi bacterium]|nr:acylphosphatase [Chloroflexota bacterium]
MSVRLEVTVRGVVQGVGYRYFVIQQVLGTGITGWVANGSRGEVICRMEGDRAALERVLADLERGPAGAVVEQVQAVWMPATGKFNGFSIRSGGHPGD